MAPGVLDRDTSSESHNNFVLATTSVQTTFAVEEFAYSHVTAKEIVSSLIRNGGCIVRNILSKSDLDEIHKDVAPYLYKNQSYDGSFFAKESSRVCGVVGKSKAFTEKIACNPLKTEVTDRLLTHHIKFWTGDNLQEATAKPQISSTIVFSITPGAKDQPLHRDDIIHHNHLPAIEAHQYKVGRDTDIAFFVAGKKTRKENGATRFIPGSHLQDSLDAPDESRAIYAELEPGDGFIMLGSSYHGGSANKTTSEERLLYACFTTKGFLRQVWCSKLCS
jgi:ectoine hydroxylase-related dioxygenase (phytanoyl-CoA dioxygenase family)